MAGRRIDALRAALAPERCGATLHPPAEWGAEALLPGGGWAAARSERGAEALLGALRRHSFAWVRWHRPRRDDATPAELFEATAKVFRSERLRSQFYADPAADAAAQAEMKPGSSSRFASFNRLPGKDYAYLRCDAERRLLPPRPRGSRVPPTGYSGAAPLEASRGARESRCRRQGRGFTNP